MWNKMHSREHTDISTHSKINLFLLFRSLSLPHVSPHSASHHSLVAKSYEADFPSSASLCVTGKEKKKKRHRVSLVSVMRWKQRLSTLIMFPPPKKLWWLGGELVSQGLGFLHQLPNQDTWRILTTTGGGGAGGCSPASNKTVGHMLKTWMLYDCNVKPEHMDINTDTHALRQTNKKTS